MEDGPPETGQLEAMPRQRHGLETPHVPVPAMAFISTVRRPLMMRKLQLDFGILTQTLRESRADSKEAAFQAGRHPEEGGTYVTSKRRLVTVIQQSRS